MQLCVRPTSRDKYLEQLRVCVHEPPPRAQDGFANQGLHYNHNMALLNLVHEEIDYLNLNGGIKHMPALDWSQDPDRLDAYGRKVATGLARVVANMLAGTLPQHLNALFRDRTAEELSESPFPLPPNFGGGNKPRTVQALFAAFREVFHYYYRAYEHLRTLKEEYEGALAQGRAGASVQDIPDEMRHPAVKAVV